MKKNLTLPLRHALLFTKTIDKHEISSFRNTSNIIQTFETPGIKIIVSLISLNH